MERAGNIEVSIILPCLNEAETLAICIKKAQVAFADLGSRVEIIVADNGSVDGSQLVARQLGAHVVHVQTRGYGSTVMSGVESSRGRYILLADVDNRYDLTELRTFLEPLRSGKDLVQGSRMPSGGGTISPGAMSWLSRYFAIPFFSFLARRWFRSTVRDIFCGMRGFSRAAYDRWALRCIGLEFSTEMIIKASLFRDRIAEVPVTFLPDTRSIRRPHLKNIWDAWRTMRLFLISCPRWLFLLPGGLAMLAGVVGYYLGYNNIRAFGVTFDINTILISSLFIIIGYQSVLFAGYTLLFAINERFLPPDPRVKWLCQKINMERGLMLGMLVFVVGLGLLYSSFELWRSQNFGAMNYQHAMRRLIPGVTLTALGFQTVLSGAFMSILGMYRRTAPAPIPKPKRLDSPWLSVIVPTYQGGHHLDSALSSVAMQNDGGIEVIIIDDGSTDGIRQVVSAWEDVLTMRIIWNEHDGNWVGSTNIGLAEAKGEWVCFLHQDDMWNQGRVAHLREMMRRHPDVNMFLHSAFFVNDKGWKVGLWKSPLPHSRPLSPSYVLPRLLVQNFIAINAPVFRRKLVEQVGPLDESLWYFADWDYWLKLAGLGLVVYNAEPLCSFRLHATSQTASRTANVEDIERQFNQVMERALASPALPEPLRVAALRASGFSRTFYLFMLSLMHKKPLHIRVVLREAMRIGPMGVVRYIRYSRLIDRVLPRLRLLKFEN